MPFSLPSGMKSQMRPRYVNIKTSLKSLTLIFTDTQDFVCHLLVVSPSKRYMASQMLQHQWLVSIYITSSCKLICMDVCNDTDIDCTRRGRDGKRFPVTQSSAEF